MPPRRKVPDRNLPANSKAPQTSKEAANASDEDSSHTETGESPTKPGEASGKAPSRRLDSLKRPTSSGFKPPLTTPSRGPISQPKFAGRRSEAARLELEKAESERKKKETEARAAREAAERARKERQAKGKDRRGGLAHGRGRGGYIRHHDHHSQQQANLASGPFSSGQANKGAAHGRNTATHAVSGSSTGGRFDGTPVSKHQPSGLSTGSGPNHAVQPARTEDGTTVKLETGARGREDEDGDTIMDVKPHISSLNGPEVASDDEDGSGIKRMNVADLEIIDLTNEEDIDPYAPIRVTRVTHKERDPGINADGATNADGTVHLDSNDTMTSAKKRGKQKTKDVEITGEGRAFQAVYSDPSDEDADPTIKSDPEDEDTEMELAGVPADVGDQQHPSGAALTAEDRRKINEQKQDPQSVAVRQAHHQTVEEAEEHERYKDDLQCLRSELGTRAVQANQETADSTSTQPNDPRAEKVYLFQFPPVLPSLSVPKVKPDPDSTDGNAGSAQPDDAKVDQKLLQKSTAQEDDDVKALNSTPNLPAGAVGKMKVHASGRVTLDWGGTSLCLGMGTSSSFLQDILIATLPESKQDNKDGVVEVESGVATSMGQVKGKFVVTPDWDEILG